MTGNNRMVIFTFGGIRHNTAVSIFGRLFISLEWAASSVFAIWRVIDVFLCLIMKCVLLLLLSLQRGEWPGDLACLALAVHHTSILGSEGPADFN